MNRPKLIYMGPFVTVCRPPLGGWRQARQAADICRMPDGTMAVRGDWLVEPVDPRGDCLDLELVREEDFEREWVIVKEALVC